MGNEKKFEKLAFLSLLDVRLSSPITHHPKSRLQNYKDIFIVPKTHEKNITFLCSSLCVILREKHVETQLLRLFYIDLTFFYGLWYGISNFFSYLCPRNYK